MYQIFTVILWIVIAIQTVIFFMQISRMSNVTFPFVFGAIIGAIIIPGIVWLIRYFIGQSIKKE